MAVETRHHIRSRILISVDLFNRSRMNLTAEKNWTISNIYTEVCDYLGIPESKIFGFAKKSGRYLSYVNCQNLVLNFWSRKHGYRLWRRKVPTDTQYALFWKIN